MIRFIFESISLSDSNIAAVSELQSKTKAEELIADLSWNLEAKKRRAVSFVDEEEIAI
jgi:hypothetical protein